MTLLQVSSISLVIKIWKCMKKEFKQRLKSHYKNSGKIKQQKKWQTEIGEYLDKIIKFLLREVEWQIRLDNGVKILICHHNY